MFNIFCIKYSIYLIIKYTSRKHDIMKLKKKLTFRPPVRLVHVHTFRSRHICLTSERGRTALTENFNYRTHNDRWRFDAVYLNPFILRFFQI